MKPVLFARNADRRLIFSLHVQLALDANLSMRLRKRRARDAQQFRGVNLMSFVSMSVGSPVRGSTAE